MSKFGKPAHKRAARMLGYALTLNNEATWWKLSALYLATLTPKERAALAWAALWSLDDDEAAMVRNAVWEGEV